MQLCTGQLAKREFPRLGVVCNTSVATSSNSGQTLRIWRFRKKSHNEASDSWLLCVANEMVNMACTSNAVCMCAHGTLHGNVANLCLLSEAGEQYTL